MAIKSTKTLMVRPTKKSVDKTEYLGLNTSNDKNLSIVKFVNLQIVAG